MKKTLTFSLLAALLVCGCQVKELDNELSNQVVESKVFTATIEDDFSADTKTSLDASGNVLWKAGDQVSIFAGSTINEQYQVSDDSEGKTAASLNKVGPNDFVAGGEIDNNVAFYPYASSAEIAKSGENYVISEITLPATQTYAENSFGNGAFPMTAITSSTSDMNLKFKNVLGGLKLQLKGTASIASISVKGNNDEILCGAAELTVSTGSTPSINLTDATAQTVVLDCGSGVQLDADEATSFIIALPPMVMSGGFTIIVIDTESKQMEIKTTKSQTIARSNILKMPAVVYEGSVVQEPFTITSTGSTSVAINKIGSPADITLEYRVDSRDWAAYTIGTGVELADGQALQFRAGEDGNSSFSTDYDNCYNISISGTGACTASGNIMSLLDKTLKISSVPSYCFIRLFDKCTNLSGTSNLELPATTLARYCYSCMFSECTNLTATPELPATTLAEFCYSGMFYSCSSLTTAPELPATTLASNCYLNMFYGCSNLTDVPELPVTTLADNCYNGMFKECINLTDVPELPASVLADYCYNDMFKGCTSLTTAPELPATTLAQYCY